jgi:phosphomannomutase
VNIISTAKDWLADDPHEETQHQLRVLIEQAGKADPDALQELHDSFNGSLEFGTAGLRGKIGPGPNRMNVVVVARAAAGLAEYLLKEKPNANLSVVIGFDARHNSELFAQVSAQIFSGYGITAKLFDHTVPTPILAFAIRHLHASAGVMVTASHNPPQDNGYKVYLASGSQIIPPADAQISACIEQVTLRGKVADLPHGSDWEKVPQEVINAYQDRTASLVTPKNIEPNDLTVVYTAMHGVGGEIFTTTATQAGFAPPIPVAKQFHPDATFPTVTFPNPEEPGAIDLAVTSAIEHLADIVIANDPDADRCAVAIPLNKEKTSWRMLHGDEVGSLLAVHIARKRKAQGLSNTASVFAQSIVSSTQLKAIAQARGYEYRVTLTGFKWIGPIPHLVFGYEEALGYCVDPDFVKDKDGISAGLLVMEMARDLKEQGQTILDALDDIAIEFGVYLTDQVSVRVSDLSLIPSIMHALRTDPPKTIAGQRVTEFIDLQQSNGGLPSTDGLLFHLESGGRVIVRPSGTEPKVKVYLQSVVPVTDHTRLEAARETAREQITAMAADAQRWLE